MNLTLAVVETCGAEGCQVTMIDDGRSLTARYSAMIRNRLKIYPGQLVAVDMDPAEPEIAWRWHRGQVLQTTPEGASLEDPGHHQVNAVQMPGLEIELTAGDEVWFTQLDGRGEIVAKVVDNKPSRLEEMKRLALPGIIQRLANMRGA